MRSLLVEGGAKVHGSFIESGCVTRLHLFIAPKVIGGQSALSWCGDLGTNLIADATDWQILTVQPLDQDFHMIAKLSNHMKILIQGLHGQNLPIRCIRNEIGPQVPAPGKCRLSADHFRSNEQMKTGHTSALYKRTMDFCSSFHEQTSHAILF